MNLTNLALEIAKVAHDGQLDKSGTEYINHPIYLASKFEDEDLKIIALLHDVIEDSNIRVSHLTPFGFKDEILVSLSYLTRNYNEEYFNYIRRIKNNELAKKVKIEDLKHNMDLSRFKNPTEKDFKRNEKYKKALEILNS